MQLARAGLFLSLLILGSAFARPREDHVSMASRVFATHTPAASTGTIEAVDAFLSGLGPELRAACQLALDDPERKKWTNVPSSAGDGGARLGDLDEEQVKLSSEMLERVLSEQGYAKMRDIMLADDRLLRGGRPRPGFGTEEYRIVIFGEPSETNPWALQLDGHHIGLNLSFHGERVTMSPSFIGTQPSAYERDGAQVVPMRGEVDDAFALVNSLSEKQRAKALIGPRRGRIVTGPGTDGQVPEPVGLACAGFDDAQRELLLSLLRRFVGDLPDEPAEARMKALAAEVDEMHFAWNGPTKNPSDVSYRIQGPSVIVEYACQDLGGNPLDHLHSMYRDPTNEYGAGF